MVDGVCKRGHLHYQDYDQTWSLEEWFDLVEAVEGLMKAAVREPLNKDQVRVIDDQSSTLLCLYFYLFQRNVTLILWFDVGSLKGLKLIVNLIGYVRVLLISF